MYIYICGADLCGYVCPRVRVRVRVEKVYSQPKWGYYKEKEKKNKENNRSEVDEKHKRKKKMLRRRVSSLARTRWSSSCSSQSSLALVCGGANDLDSSSSSSSCRSNMFFPTYSSYQRFPALIRGLLDFHLCPFPPNLAFAFNFLVLSLLYLSNRQHFFLSWL